MILSYIKKIGFRTKCHWCNRRLGPPVRPQGIHTAGYTICHQCARKEGRRLINLATEIETKLRNVAPVPEVKP